MEFGITVPNNWGIDDPQQVLAFGPLAEQLGYNSVWVMDHLFNNGYIRERLDDKPYYHPMAVLSYLSATTNRVLLGTSVLVLPYHNPVELAKYAATLDQMSGGRVTLGVGVGAMTEEFAALGIPMNRRGSMTNESIRIMKELWTQEDPSYQSRRWNFTDLKFSPKPAQKPHIPLWIGGASPGALRRAATLGDGWHPSSIGAENYSIGRREIQEMAEAAGRAPESLTWSARLEVLPPGGPEQRRPSGAGNSVHGDNLDEIIAAVAAYQTAGVEHMVLALSTGDVVVIAQLMEELAQRVLPEFR